MKKFASVLSLLAISGTAFADTASEEDFEAYADVSSDEAGAAYSLAAYGPPSDVDFVLYSHLQNIGQESTAPDQWTGTTGEKRRLEAFQVVPQGNWPSCLQLMYMAHVEKSGDTGWTAAPHKVGTEGKSLRIEGVAFKLVGACSNDYTVEYACHIQNQGDSALMRDGNYCGTRDQKRRLEAFKLTVRHR